MCIHDFSDSYDQDDDFDAPAAPRPSQRVHTVTKPSGSKEDVLVDVRPASSYDDDGARLVSFLNYADEDAGVFTFRLPAEQDASAFADAFLAAYAAPPTMEGLVAALLGQAPPGWADVVRDFAAKVVPESGHADSLTKGDLEAAAGR